MCHACHAKCRGVTASKTGPSAPPEPVQCHKCLPDTHSHGRCHQVQRLPRETTVDVTKCHACHAKRRWMSPSATTATQSAAASRRLKPAQARHQSQPSATSATSATPATQNEGGCHQVPRLPGETKVYVTKGHKCHACHAKRRWMSPSATPATQSAAASRRLKPAAEPVQCHK